MPSAVSPRATAVRIPGSSSTTSTRAIAAEPTGRASNLVHLRSLSAAMSHADAPWPTGAERHRTGRRVAAAHRRGRRGRAGPAGGPGRRPSAARSCRRSTPEELVSSVLAAQHEPFAGTVELDNELGLPALPDAPQAADGTSTARVWSDGEGRGRVQLPTDGGERTLVSDGTTFWAWNSEDRTVVTGPPGGPPSRRPGRRDRPRPPRPTRRSTRLRASSEVTVDGTAEVAGRPAYELVLTPKPTERTLLREIRIAVDAEKRVAAAADRAGQRLARSGAAGRVHRARPSAPQDPALFTFTPPPGATVEQRQPSSAARPARRADRTVVGEGWDTVVVTQAPGRAAPDEDAGGAPDLSDARHPGQRPVGQRPADQHRRGDRDRHRRRSGRRRRRARAGAHRGPQPGDVSTPDRRRVEAGRRQVAAASGRLPRRSGLRGPGHRAAQGLRPRRSPSTASTSTSRPARCSACSARTARARPR